MKRLTDIGFQNAGHWKLNGDQLELELTCLSDAKNVLYAFVSNDEVKYIGKTARALEKRLYGYKYPGPTQSTNIKNNAHIKNILEAGEPVDIWVLADDGHLSFGGYRISLAAGLEDSLISNLTPPWNGRGPAISSEISSEPDSREIPPVEAENQNKSRIVPQKTNVDRESVTFDFQLRQTYYDQGFFNIRVEFMHAFAGNEAPIEIFLGKHRTLVEGYINRSVNSNNTPRIMGGVQLRDWFQRNRKINGWLSVEILTPKSIWIR